MTIAKSHDTIWYMKIPINSGHKARFLGQFFRHVEVKRLRECWPWNDTDREHYGQFKFRGQQEAAHRVMWKIIHGDVSQDRFICHRCDYKPCVNPLHLFCGTADDNTQDMINKGRDRFRGEQNGRAKLTREQVEAIKIEYAQGGISQKNLGRKYRVSEAAVYFIVHGKTWR